MHITLTEKRILSRLVSKFLVNTQDVIWALTCEAIQKNVNKVARSVRNMVNASYCSKDLDKKSGSRLKRTWMYS